MFAQRAVIAGLAAAGAVAVFVHSSPGASGESSYRVQPGDTLWSIAERHYAGDPRKAVWELQERNGLEGSDLAVGQRLLLP